MRTSNSFGELSDSFSSSSSEDRTFTQTYTRSSSQSLQRSPKAIRGRPFNVSSTLTRSTNVSRGRGRQSRVGRKQTRPLHRDTRVLNDIKKLQDSVKLILPKLPFSRVVREAMQNCSSSVDRVTPEALAALQESTEMYLVQFLEDAYLLTLHRQRVTLSIQDLRLVGVLRHFAS